MDHRRLPSRLVGAAAALCAGLVLSGAPALAQDENNAEDLRAPARFGVAEEVSSSTRLNVQGNHITFDEIVRRSSILQQFAPRVRKPTEMPFPGRSGGIVDLDAIFEAEGRPIPDLSRQLTTAADSPDWGSDLTVEPKMGLTSDAVTLTFQGAGDPNTSIPADTTGAVGPDHVVTILNTQLVIRDKDGVLAEPPVSLTQFFAAGLGSVPGTAFDPRIQYDPDAEQWVAVALVASFSPNSAIVFAVSDGPDPTGGWTFFIVDADANNTNWADFPGLGINSKWIVVTNNMFTISGGSFVASKMWVVERSTIASGSAAVNVFQEGFDSAGGAPGATMKPASPDDSSDGEIFLVDNSGYSFTGSGIQLIRLSSLTGPESSPSWAPITNSDPSLGTSGLFAVPNNFSFAFPLLDQFGTAFANDTGDIRISASSKERNGSVWFAHAGGFPSSAPNRLAIYWYQIDPSLMGTTGAPIIQTGILDDGPNTQLAYPSIAVNSANDAVIGFTRASTSIWNSAGLAVRLAGDALGTMRAIQTFKAGEDEYFQPRWGDYSETVVDPTDDVSIWTVQKFSDFPSSNFGIQWARVGTGVPAPSCIPDVTTSGATLVGQPGFGVPDGIVDLDDLGYFLGFWLVGDLTADVTTTGGTLVGQPGFGFPDGIIDLDDLGYFLGFWLEGCP
ncbi:MAG: GC-type dockerin domain-anchored protein [Planctomycetota bacterium]